MLSKMKKGTLIQIEIWNKTKEGTSIKNNLQDNNFKFISKIQENYLFKK